jgi:GNAT superfamily N-acetyltransferase
MAPPSVRQAAPYEMAMRDLAAYAALLPDVPRWLDTRGILLCWPAAVIEGPEHSDDRPAFVVVSEAEPIAAVVGRPGRAAIERAVARLVRMAGGARVDVLCQPKDAWELAGLLAGWTPDGATLHRLPGDAIGPDAPDLRRAWHPAYEIALVHPDDRARMDPGSVPGNIYQELDLTWRRGRPVAVAFADERPAAFLSAALETGGWWDVSVETLPEHRRRGLAAGCFRALHAFYRELGKRAVWGAHHSNPASLRLATRLGFVPDCDLMTFSRP